MQTIGRAATGISDDLRSKHPDVPRRQIMDMRNLLAYGYRYVDPAIVWEVVRRQTTGRTSTDIESPLSSMPAVRKAGFTRCCKGRSPTDGLELEMMGASVS